MSSRAFVDTNVLVYLFDSAEPVKQRRAEALLRQSDVQLIISSQVLGEFFVSVTRAKRRAALLALEDAEEAVRELADLAVVSIDADLVTAAIARSTTDHTSYWDALIIEAAAFAGCDRLLTEDLNHGQVFGRVRVENPFIEIE